MHNCTYVHARAHTHRGCCICTCAESPKRTHSARVLWGWSGEHVRAVCRARIQHLDAATLRSHGPGLRDRTHRAPPPSRAPCGSPPADGGWRAAAAARKAGPQAPPAGAARPARKAPVRVCKTPVRVHAGEDSRPCARVRVRGRACAAPCLAFKKRHRDRCAMCTVQHCPRIAAARRRHAARRPRYPCGGGCRHGSRSRMPVPTSLCLPSPLLRLLLEARDEGPCQRRNAQDAARGGAGAGMRGAAGGGVRTGSADACWPGGACRRVAAASACMRGRAGRGPCGGPRAAAAGALGGVCGRREQRRAHAFARERRVLQ